MRMKVMYYFRDINTVMYQWQRYHIVDEMMFHNCSIEIISPTYYQSIEECNEAIIKKLRDNVYDLFMTCLNDEFLFPETLLRIKEIGMPTLLFCPDNLTAPFIHERIASLFDLVWLTSKETKYIFEQWGCYTVFLPYAANPHFLVPQYNMMEELSIGFIGSPHGSRIDRINFFLEYCVPITMHTNSQNLDATLIKAPLSDYIKTLIDFMRYPLGRRMAIAAIIDKLTKRKLIENEYLSIQAAVPLQNLAEFNCKYALILSFTDAASTGVLKKPIPIVNLRNFEIPMSGGIQLTLYSDELASYFDNDKEIVMGYSMEECVDKAKFYLSERQYTRRKEIRIAARKRAEMDHTWYRRFSKVFEAIGI